MVKTLSPSQLKSIAELQGHDERVWHVAWNPKKPLLATCSADKTIRLYSYSQIAEAVTFSHIHTIDTGHSRTVRSLAWSPNGRTLACASFDSTVSTWERSGEENYENSEHESEGAMDDSDHDWECVATLEGPESEIKGVAYSANGTFLATCSRDKSVWIWEVLPDNEHETLSVLMGQHTQDVKCVAWHPTSEILASGSYDDTIKLYVDDPSDDWYDFATLKGHSSTVWSLAFSPSGQYLASASDDCTIRLWTAGGAAPDKPNWQCVHILREHSRTIYSISWGVNPNDKDSVGWLASGAADGKINVWDIAMTEPDPSSYPSSKMLVSINNAHGVADINAVAWCSRPGYENLLASVGDDFVSRIWRLLP